MQENKKNWKVKTVVEKYNSEEDFQKGILAETHVSEGNLLLEQGINALWLLVTGDVSAPDAFGSGSYIGVGSSNATEAATQTGLLGSDFVYKGMDTGYPVVSGTKVSYKATFELDEAVHAWNEWTVANDDGGTGGAGLIDGRPNNQSNIINLNRKVDNMGVKGDGAKWIITVEISLS